MLYTALLSFFVTRILPILLILGALWWTYNWIYARGSHSRDQEVATLNAKIVERDNIIAAARQTAANQEKAFSAAVENLKKEQQATLVVLGEQLSKAQNRNRQLQESLNVKVPKYVTAKGDAACVVPVGFVRLHNEALGTATGGTTEAATVPSSGPQDVDAASGVALSATASTIAGNYGECVERGEVISAWQKWYNTNLKSWQDAVAEQANFKRVTPLLVTP